MPFFGDKLLSEVTPGLVQQYRAKRMQSQTRFGKPPARSTLHREIVILRQILKNANRQGWIGVVPDLSPPYKTSRKITHRAWFSPDEYKKLYTANRKRAAAPLKRRWKWVSEQLHDYVLLLANTGLRPDEAARLEFRDVAVIKDHGSQETILEIEVRGKRGVGFCKSTAQAVLPFERLKKRLRPAPKGADGSASHEELPARRPKGVAAELGELVLPGPTDRLFVGSQRELFNTILAEEGLKKDRDGKLRTAYSLRHTYICFRLMERADIYQIAKNCRTSVEMIEKFYAAHIKTRLDASAINVRRGTIRREQEMKRMQTAEPPQARIMRSRRLAKRMAGEDTPSIASLAGRPHPASLRRGPRGEMVDATDLSRED